MTKFFLVTVVIVTAVIVTVVIVTVVIVTAVIKTVVMVVSDSSDCSNSDTKFKLWQNSKTKNWDQAQKF